MSIQRLAQPFSGVYSLPFLKAAQDLLAAIMLRCTKVTVKISVSPRELPVFIPMGEVQRGPVDCLPEWIPPIWNEC
jgi:hypothetical protein